MANESWSLKQLQFSDWQAAQHLVKQSEEETISLWGSSLWQQILQSSRHEVWGHWGVRSCWHSVAVLALNGLEAEVELIVVTPSARRHGLAQALIKQLMMRAQQHQCEQLWLEVAATNQAAIALYQRLGFQRQGIRRNYYSLTNCVRVDALLWTYSLLNCTSEHK